MSSREVNQRDFTGLFCSPWSFTQCSKEEVELLSGEDVNGVA
jgi:hypothetical protein